MIYRLRGNTIAIGVAVLTLMASPGTSMGAPLGTGFTYQGQLKLLGNPLSDTADFEFTLWGAATGGAAIGAVDAHPGVNVVNGLFTVQLDLGSNVFEGDARWLNIRVAYPAGGSYVTLSPRQPITPVPYATKAIETVGIDGHSLDAVDGSPADAVYVNAGGQVRLSHGGLNVYDDAGHGISFTSDEFSFNEKTSEDPVYDYRSDSDTHTFYTNGERVLSIANNASVGIGMAWNEDPAAKLHINGTAGTDGIMFPDGTLQTTAATGDGGSSPWSESASNIFYNTGNVGIGTDSPTSSLHVITDAWNPIRSETTAADGHGLYARATSTSGITYGVHATAASTGGRGVYGSATADSGSTEGVHGRSASPSGRGVFGLAASNSGTNFGVYGTTFSPDGYAGYFTGGRNYFEGDVGIGTESPDYPLHVETSSDRAISATTSSSNFARGVSGIASAPTGVTYGVRGESASAAGRGVMGYASAQSGSNRGGWFTSESTSGIGVAARANAFSGTTYGVWGETASPDGYAGYFLGGRNYFEGNVGIGTDTPEHPLHVETSRTGLPTNENPAISATNWSTDSHATGVLGQAKNATGFNYGLRGESEGDIGRGVYGVANATTGTTYGGKFDSKSNNGTGVAGLAESDTGTNFGVQGHTNSSNGYAGHFTGGRNYFEGNVGIGTETPEHPLHVETSGDRAIVAATNHAGGVGVTGTASIDSGQSYGVIGESHGTLGRGVYGHATTMSGDNHGGRFISNSTTGRGVSARAQGVTGINYGVYSKTFSPDGYSGYFLGGRNYFEGRVGIGISSPSTDVKLQITGADANIRIHESGGNPYIELGDTSTQKGYLQWFSSTNRLMLYSSGHSYPIAIGRTDMGGIFVDTDANDSDVGIGTEAPQYKLHVAGSAGKPGGGSWTNSSDRRLKKNIENLEGSLDRLMKLRSVTFEYKNPESINELPGTRLGMIAQEVEEVFPDWVSEGGHGYKTLTFRGFEALTVEALRELRQEKDREIEELREKSTNLESRVAQLEALVAKLAAYGNGGGE